MRMSTPLKIGVIGLGRMGQLYARTLATRVSGVQLYAVADVSEQARTRVADEFSVTHAFSDAYELPWLTFVNPCSPTDQYAS